MKSKDNFFAEEDYEDSSKKKTNKFHNTSRETTTDKLGNPIRVGDLTQVILKDGTFLNQCEVLEVAGGMVTVLHDSGDEAYEIPTFKVPTNSVVVISI